MNIKLNIWYNSCLPTQAISSLTAQYVKNKCVFVHTRFQPYTLARATYIIGAYPFGLPPRRPHLLSVFPDCHLRFLLKWSIGQTQTALCEAKRNNYEKYMANLHVLSLINYDTLYPMLIYPILLPGHVSVIPLVFLASCYVSLFTLCKLSG